MHIREGRCTLDGMSNKGAPAHLCSMSEIRSCSRWAYEGEVEQWSKEEAERERELAEMTGSLEQLAGLEEKEEEEEESGSSVRGSETCLRIVHRRCEGF